MTLRLTYFAIFLDLASEVALFAFFSKLNKLKIPDYEFDERVALHYETEMVSPITE